MKNSVVRGLFCLALIFSVCLLNACSRHNRGAEDILYEICASLSLPAGQTYLAHTEEGGEHYLSSDTAQSLYGAESVENTFPLIEDYAIYISSFAEPCEIAVFSCYSRSDTDTVSAMCLARADEIAVLLKGSEGEYPSAEITTYKKYIVMLLCEDTDRALETAREALK
ncbi:MAG: hypothetical protein IJV72_04085 [Clostridia bacterium]|nr:hypothetical protein [Clostridia bacterium]